MLTPKKNTCLRLDPEMVEAARMKCEPYGISLPTLINIFLRQFVESGEVTMRINFGDCNLLIRDTDIRPDEA